MKHTYFKKFLVATCFFFCFSISIEKDLLADNNETVEAVGEEIPPGYKTISIEIRNPSEKESSVKMGYRVDVVSNQNQQDGGAKKTTIARFMKVLSNTNKVNKDADKSKIATSNVFLMVTEEQYRDINLAKESGASIGLGNISNPSVEDPCARWDASSMRDYIRRCTKTKGNSFISDEPVDGEIYKADPKTGKLQRYILKNGKWSLDKSFVGRE